MVTCIQCPIEGAAGAMVRTKSYKLCHFLSNRKVLELFLDQTCSSIVTKHHSARYNLDLCITKCLSDFQELLLSTPLSIIKSLLQDKYILGALKKMVVKHLFKIALDDTTILRKILPISTSRI